MTIADHLVEETGRAAASYREDAPEATLILWAQGRAREIVAAVYGPPCKRFEELGTEWPLIECATCGWPESMHKKEEPHAT